MRLRICELNRVYKKRDFERELWIWNSKTRWTTLVIPYLIRNLFIKFFRSVQCWWATFEFCRISLFRETIKEDIISHFNWFFFFSMVAIGLMICLQVDGFTMFARGWRLVIHILWIGLSFHGRLRELGFSGMMEIAVSGSWILLQVRLGSENGGGRGSSPRCAGISRCSLM